MVDVPYEALLGIAYGLLTGFVAAASLGLLAIGLRVSSDRPLPVAAGGVTAAALAIGSCVAIGIFDPVGDPSQLLRVAMAGTVAGVLGVVATTQGNRVATELPRDRHFPIVRGQALSADAIDAVDAMGQVTIRPTGAIREFEGYPPLSPTLRGALEEGAWRFPADLQLSELESRLERRLRTEHDLSLVDVSIDGRGRATIAAAPPTKGVASTLPDGKRAVTVSGLLPTGIERGDRIAIDATGTTVHGEVLAIGPGAEESDGVDDEPGGSSADHRRADAGFDGGEGRLTVAVETSDAGPLLEGTDHRIVVLPSGDNHALEAAALLEEAGQPVTALALPVTESTDLETTLGIRVDERWRFGVDDGVDAADRAFVAGAPTEVGER